MTKRQKSWPLKGVSSLWRSVICFPRPPPDELQSAIFSNLYPRFIAKTDALPIVNGPMKMICRELESFGFDEFRCGVLAGRFASRSLLLAVLRVTVKPVAFIHSLLSSGADLRRSFRQRRSSFFSCAGVDARGRPHLGLLSKELFSSNFRRILQTDDRLTPTRFAIARWERPTFHKATIAPLSARETSSPVPLRKKNSLKND